MFWCPTKQQLVCRHQPWICCATVLLKYLGNVRTTFMLKWLDNVMHTLSFGLILLSVQDISSMLPCVCLLQWYNRTDYPIFTQYQRYRRLHPQQPFYILHPHFEWQIWQRIQDNMAEPIQKNPPSSGLLGMKNTGWLASGLLSVLVQSGSWKSHVETEMEPAITRLNLFLRGQKMFFLFLSCFTMFCLKWTICCISCFNICKICYVHIYTYICFSHSQAPSWWCRCARWCTFMSSCRPGERRSSAITTSVSMTPPAHLAPITPCCTRRTWWNEWTRALTATSTLTAESHCLVSAQWTALRPPNHRLKREKAAETKTQTKAPDAKPSPACRTKINAWQPLTHCRTKNKAVKI